MKIALIVSLLVTSLALKQTLQGKVVRVDDAAVEVDVSIVGVSHEA